MGFHLKSGAETAVAMRGEVADVMVRVARQLFENDGFNKLCRSLTKEFQKRSSKVRPAMCMHPSFLLPLRVAHIANELVEVPAVDVLVRHPVLGLHIHR